MATALIATLLDEPAVPDPPRRVWRDWLLVGVFAPVAVLEGLFGTQATWRPLAIVVVVGLVFTLLWRRTHPLAMTVLGFGAILVLDQSLRVASGDPLEYYTAAILLLHPYALFRWASGRHAAIGIGVLIVALVAGVSTDWTGFGDLIGGAIVVAFPAVLGVEVRHLVGSRERNLEQARVRERALLARELHDTVAHHVSAIAIRAQAGRVVGAGDPEAALDALVVIEAEASRTLAEMRSIVGTLRGSAGAELAPQPGIADIERLAASPGGLPVAIHVPDDLGDLGPTVGTALYRMAQEGITNARRHARGATLVTVRLCTDGDRVRLTVDDDGRVGASPAAGSHGYGLVGMAERAHLLGGSLEAGPMAPRGWRIDASVPRDNAVRRDAS